MQHHHDNVCGLDRYIWAYWISPLAYLLRAVVINEMTSPAWRTPVAAQGGGTTTAGEASLLDVQRKLHVAIVTQLHVCMRHQRVLRLTRCHTTKMQVALESFDFFTQRFWIWVCVGYVIFLVCLSLA